MRRKKLPRRLRRLAHLANIRHQARLQAERQYRDWLVRRSVQPYTVADFYRLNMKGQGHWLKGGCSNVNCGLCQPRERRFADRRELCRLDQELAEYFRR